MNWFERLFHEPRDPEIDAIRGDLETEKNRHNKELGKVTNALRDLSEEYEYAERERLGDTNA